MISSRWRRRGRSRPCWHPCAAPSGLVYAKRPFAGPAAVLAYLSRYTHRVAISNSRLISMDDRGVTFRWKDYRARAKAPGNGWIKALILPADEFIHRIRHYGLFASAVRAANIDRIRALLEPREENSQRLAPSSVDEKKEATALRCRCCGGSMTVIETFAHGALPRTWSAEPFRFDSS